MESSVVRLIAITDNVRDGQNGLIARAAAAVCGGATMIQLRLKDVAARDLVGLAWELVASAGAPVIVNDRADIAIAAGAAGVHLGPEDLTPSAVRVFAPPGFIVGASLGSDDEVAHSAGADYIGVGPVFVTGSKKDAGKAIGVEEFTRLAALCGLPAVGIGGVTARNARAVIDAGATGVAVIASIFGSTDPQSAAREILSAIGK